MTETDAEFERLLTYLHEARGFDFTGYKQLSLMRRVRRQMGIVGVESYEQYQDYLQVHQDEFTALFNTILINVTGFFRDADAWTYLREELLPELIAHHRRDPIRVWSAGCASGEEPYSLAMALADVLGPEDFGERVKIYATDVDEEALAYARQATYTDRELRGLSPELVAQYFESVGQRRTFRKDFRRSVIFGRNNLMQDAPISHVDLLVCRNTLMYFNAETQERILKRLHFALNPDGVLFLGKAEMLLSHTALFTPVELKRRFFRKVPYARTRERRALVPDGEEMLVPSAEDNGRIREQALMSSPAAQVVIDATGRLLLSNHRAEMLFGVGMRDAGRPFQDLDISYRPVELRSYVDLATTERRPVWAREVIWQRPGAEPMAFDVQVVPLASDDGVTLGTTVIFNDVSRYRQLQTELEYANRQLETAYEELQSTNEELETTNEELQSTVEELETTNEELQSTNEELETMNEELQSMNDELQSTNDELRQRTEEVNGLNGFMEAILASIRTGITVVDRDLRILAWNRRAEDMWGMRPEEAIDQHLLNLDIGLPVEKLRPLLRRQLSGENTDHDTDVTVEAVNRRGRSVNVRVTVSPLLRGGNGVAGAIIVMDTT